MHAWGCACAGCGYARQMGAVDPALLQQGIQATTEITSAILASRAARKAQEAAAAAAAQAPTWTAPVVAAPVPVPASGSSSSLTPLTVFVGGLLVVAVGGVFFMRSRRGR